MIDLVIVGACGLIWITTILGTIMLKLDIRRSVRVITPIT